MHVWGLYKWHQMRSNGQKWCCNWHPVAAQRGCQSWSHLTGVVWAGRTSNAANAVWWRACCASANAELHWPVITMPITLTAKRHAFFCFEHLHRTQACKSNLRTDSQTNKWPGPNCSYSSIRHHGEGAAVSSRPPHFGVCNDLLVLQIIFRWKLWAPNFLAR